MKVWVDESYTRENDAWLITKRPRQSTLFDIREIPPEFIERFNAVQSEYFKALDTVREFPIIARGGR